VLGRAVARYGWAADEGEGPPCGPDHIARIAYARAGGSDPLWFDYELEPSRGLGFSAAARAAGAVLGYLQQGLGSAEAQEAAYQVVAGIEGHGDNAAPSAFGGTWVIAGDVHHRIPGDLPGRLLFWVPDVETLTDDSRACLPQEVPRADALFNLGRVGLLLAAIYEGRIDLLARATEDRLHQPDRLAACEPAAKAYEGALAAGAAAAWLSGSGPTIAVVVDDGSHRAVEAVLVESGRVIELEPDHQGAILAG
jgi:homoserine kinase